MLVVPHSQNYLTSQMPKNNDERAEKLKEAEHLRRIPLTSREVSDVIMIGIGAFTPLTGFMGKEDWKSSCTSLWNATHECLWPIPITLSISKNLASSIIKNEKVALFDVENKLILGTMIIRESYEYDKEFECNRVFKTVDLTHPGVAKVMAQEPINVAGEVELLSEGHYPSAFPGVYQTPEQARESFEIRKWSTVAALQLRNPMHNSHLYLAWIAMEICDGVYVHQLLGNLKDDDIPANIRTSAVDAVVKRYLNQDHVTIGGFPLEMRYAGPREALLHAIIRQNYGCSHIIIGRDHAGVGKYYGPFDAQNIFRQVPTDALQIKALPLDWTFYCYKCQAMASMKTCPHEEPAQINDEGVYCGGARLLLSGTLLRKLLFENKGVPAEFSKPEAIEILRNYYATKKKA